MAEGGLRKKKGRGGSGLWSSLAWSLGPGSAGPGVNGCGILGGGGRGALRVVAAYADDFAAIGCDGAGGHFWRRGRVGGSGVWSAGLGCREGVDGNGRRC